MSNGFNALGIGAIQTGALNTTFDWKKQQEEMQKKWEEEKKNRKAYFENTKVEYESICKQIGYCIYQYVGENTFKPELLMQNYDFLRMKNMGIVSKNYEKYIDFVREQDYYKKQQAKKKKKKKSWHRSYYSPWSFKDRWDRVIHRLKDLKHIEEFTEKVHGTYMTFYRINKDKVIELKKEAFIHFI